MPGIFMLACLLFTPVSQAGEALVPVTGRPVHTCSTVARGPESGQLDVAVQSHWFSAGSLVPWAQAGVSAITKQLFIEYADQ